MKTLGQIACEAFNGGPIDVEWGEFPKIEAAWEAAAAAVERNHIPPELFDGFNVYQSLSDETKKRTSPENVSDVLDAVVRLMRSNA